MKSFKMKNRLLSPCVLALGTLAFLGGTANTSFAEPTSVEADYTFKQVKFGGGGYVVGIAIHPDKEGPMYVRTDVGGIYRWDDTEWTQLFVLDSIPEEALNVTGTEDAGLGVPRSHVYHVEAIAIDPANPDVVIVGAGKFRDRPGVMLLSTDRGETFEMCDIDAVMVGNAEGRFTNERLAFQPGGTGVVLFGSRLDGLYRSTDGGLTFDVVEGVPSGDNIFGIGPVVFDDQQPNVAMLCVDGVGTFRSEDGGESWEKVGARFGTDLEISNGVAYLTGGRIGVRQYEDGDWDDVSPPIANVVDLAVHPTNSDKVYAMTDGGQQLYRTDNGGESWQLLAASSLTDEGQDMYRSPDMMWLENSDVRDWLSIGDLRFDPRNPDRLWFAEGMGIWQSSPLSEADPEVGPMFTNMSMGIEETVASDVHAAPGGKITFLMRDRAGHVKNGYDALDVYPSQQIPLTDTFTMGIRVNAQGTNPQFLVATLTDSRQPSGAMNNTGYDGDGNHSGYSTDGGLTWTQFESINPETEFNNPREAKFGEIAVDAENPDSMVWLPRVYIDSDGKNGADQSIFYTTDRGKTWVPAEIGDYWDRREHYLVYKQSLAADPVTPGRFYAYHWEKGTIYRSDDGGATWIEPEGVKRATGYAYHNQLRVTPGRAGELWLATGYDLRAPESETGLYHSTDAGMSWAKLPGVDEAWAIGFGKAEVEDGPPTLFLYGLIEGTWGLYRSTDEARSFDLISEAPHGIFDQVTCVTGDPDVFGMVYVGFQGNGFVYGRPNNN